jgi:hypothetical protein
MQNALCVSLKEGEMILQIEKLNINNSIHSHSYKRKNESTEEPEDRINFDKRKNI